MDTITPDQIERHPALGEIIGFVEIAAFVPPKYRKRPIFIASDLGVREPVNAMLAASGRSMPAGPADHPIAFDWADFDRMLERFDQGAGPEPQGPHATRDQTTDLRFDRRDEDARLLERLLPDIVYRFLAGDTSVSWLAGHPLVFARGKDAYDIGPSRLDDPFEDEDEDEDDEPEVEDVDEPDDEHEDGPPPPGTRGRALDWLLAHLRAGTMPTTQPEIDKFVELAATGRTIGGTSERTARRRAAERAELVGGARPLSKRVGLARRQAAQRDQEPGGIARDQRTTPESIRRRVDALRSATGLRMAVCIHCGERFEAKRSDAEFCPPPKSCRQKARRANGAKGASVRRNNEKPAESMPSDQVFRDDVNAMLAASGRSGPDIVDVDAPILREQP